MRRLTVLDAKVLSRAFFSSKEGGLRFRDFKTPETSDKVLVDILNKMVSFGYLSKTVGQGRRPLYKLTENGRTALNSIGFQLIEFEDVKHDVENLALEKEDLIELERQLDQLPTVRTFRQLIDELLSKNGPMHYKKLTEEILKVKQTKGKTPDQTVLAILERGTRGQNPKYVKVGPGTYGLNPSYQKEE